MPEMDGGETYEKLKEINPNVKVILTTGYAINDEVRVVMNRGCRGLHRKPFKINQLSKKIREVLVKD